MTTGAVAVLASRVRLEEKRIFDALDRRGVPYHHIDTRTWWRSATTRPIGWRGALNRELAATRALAAARTAEAGGVPVLNSAAATEVCADKWRTTLALVEAGIPVPRTALALTPDAALAALDELGYPAVIKPVTGSWGRLVTRLSDRETAAGVLEYVEAFPSPAAHVVYVQELVGTGRHDLRAIVVGGEVLGVVHRRSDQWRSNVARGATTEYCAPTPELTKLALAATAAVGAEIAGVDLIEDAEGRLLVIEVNHGVEFSGFQAAMGDRVDVAGAMVDLLLSRAADDTTGGDR